MGTSLRSRPGALPAVRVGAGVTAATHARAPDRGTHLGDADAVLNRLWAQRRTAGWLDAHTVVVVIGDGRMDLEAGDPLRSPV